MTATEPAGALSILERFPYGSTPTQECGLEEYLERYFSLSAREEATRNNRLYSVEIELTKRCNLECPYCYSKSHRSSPEFLAPEIVKRILSEGYEYGLRSVSWFGGEPLMYPNLLEVLQYARDIGYRESILYTNGCLIKPIIARELRGVIDTISIHLDSIDCDVFARLHYNKSPKITERMHSDILRSFGSLLEEGFSGSDIRLCLTLSRPVFQGIDSLFSWAFNKLKLQTSIFIPVAPFGCGTEIPKSWFLSPDEMRLAYKKRARYEGRSYLLNLGFSEYCKQYQITMCYITASGDVLPYAGSGIICDNIFSQSFDKIICQHYETISFTVPNRTHETHWALNGCKSCDNNRFCFGTPVLGNQIAACSFFKHKMK